jgi:hypothetical protein
MEKNRYYKVTIKQHGKYTDSIEGFSTDLRGEIIPLIDLVMEMFENTDIEFSISNRKDEKEGD